MLVIVGDTDSEDMCPSRHGAPLMISLRAMPRASQFLVLKLLADRALHPTEFCSAFFVSQKDVRSTICP